MSRFPALRSADRIPYLIIVRSRRKRPAARQQNHPIAPPSPVVASSVAPAAISAWRRTQRLTPRPQGQTISNRSRELALPSPSRSTNSFRSFDLGPELERALGDAGFTEPRPIQTETIPAALAGRDVLGLSHTGSGKTAAFALPILARLSRTRGTAPRALILAPTRELAAQIESHFTTLAVHTRVRIVSVFGGVSMHAQISALRARPDIVVACPGRLLDLVERGHIDLRRIEVLVLDEADHMFDLGFLPDVRRILAVLPAQRQNFMFSATMPREIRTLADRVLRKPHVAELANSGPAETIAHSLCMTEEPRKLDLLRAIFGRPDFTSAIVFSRTKRRTKVLADRLGKLGLRAVALQGNMSQSQRVRAMQGFSTGRYNILAATDVASRGIDVAGISHVINYDVPSTPETYTHRIGRTGRSECTGQAFTFATSADAVMIRAIEKMLGSPIPRDESLRNAPAHEPMQFASKSSTRSRPPSHRQDHGPRRDGGHSRHARPPQRSDSNAPGLRLVTPRADETKSNENRHHRSSSAPRPSTQHRSAGAHHSPAAHRSPTAPRSSAAHRPSTPSRPPASRRDQASTPHHRRRSGSSDWR